MPGVKKCLINISCVPGAAVIVKASVLEGRLNPGETRSTSKVRSGDNRAAWCSTGLQGGRCRLSEPEEAEMGVCQSWEGLSSRVLMGRIWLGTRGCQWQAVVWGTPPQVRRGTDQVLLHLAIQVPSQVSGSVCGCQGHR